MSRRCGGGRNPWCSPWTARGRNGKRPPETKVGWEGVSETDMAVWIGGWLAGCTTEAEGKSMSCKNIKAVDLSL